MRSMNRIRNGVYPKVLKRGLGKGGINDITCTQDGALLAVASKIGIWIYDFQTGEELALLTGHTGHINSISFSSGWQNPCQWES